MAVERLNMTSSSKCSTHDEEANRIVAHNKYISNLWISSKQRQDARARMQGGLNKAHPPERWQMEPIPVAGRGAGWPPPLRG